MLGRQRAPSDTATTSTIGLAITATFFAGALVMMQVAVTSDDGKDPRTATLTAHASTALELMVRNAGFTTDGQDWTEDADAMSRFGLADGTLPQFLSYDKVRALRQGLDNASPDNDAPDYPEVKAALGLEEDFHLRSYPVLLSVDDARWQKDSHLKAAYFAHYSGATAPVDVTASAVQAADSLNVSVTLRNDASFAAVFVATVSLGDVDDGETFVTDERHTRLLAPGESTTVWVNFWSLASWDANIDAVKILVTDPYGNLAVDTSSLQIGEQWIASSPPPTASPNAYNLLLYASDVYFRSGQTVAFTVDHYDKNVNRVNGAQARVVLVGPDGNEWKNETVSLPKNKGLAWECANCTTAGNYTAIAWDTGMTRAAVDTVHVSAAPMFTDKSTMDPRATKEIQLLGELMATFNPTRYDAVTNPTGDVFADDTNHPSDLMDVLDRYTSLIVGSEVSQTALNSANTKYGIADWVDAGGNLIVLGTEEQQSRWLEPVYFAAQETAGGGISAPDPTHPILTTPEVLDHARYLDRARAWHIKNDQEFSHVLTRGASGNGVEDTLALSSPGAFDDGTVTLTSYMPGALTDPQDDAEAKRFLHNLLSQGHSMLFLDYGPPIPEGIPIGSATRLVVVPHPNVPDAHVEVKLVMYTW